MEWVSGGGEQSTEWPWMLAIDFLLGLSPVVFAFREYLPSLPFTFSLAVPMAMSTRF